MTKIIYTLRKCIFQYSRLLKCTARAKVICDCTPLQRLIMKKKKNTRYQLQCRSKTN